MERHQHVVVIFLSHLGQVCGYVSHKPEFLRTSLMVSVGNVPPFWTKRYRLPLLDFNFFPSVNIEQHGCCVNFWDFSGFAWTFLYINWVFNAFMCIIQIWTTCTCSSAYKLVENQIYVLGCILRSHARNENEFQTPGHRWLPAKHWDAWFLNSRKSNTHLKFMKLGMLSWSGINMQW